LLSIFLQETAVKVMAASMSSRILLLVALLVSSFILMTSATSSEIYESRGVKSANGGEEYRTEKDKRPFFVGSRYGRSQSDLTNMDENGKSNNLARIVPRNDRFFFGSRYGKRSLPEAAVDVEQNQLLTCFYTGVTNIFRCVDAGKLSYN